MLEAGVYKNVYIFGSRASFATDLQFVFISCLAVPLMEFEEDLATLLKNISSAKYPEIITFLLKLRGDTTFESHLSLYKMIHIFKPTQTLKYRHFIRLSFYGAD